MDDTTLELLKMYYVALKDGSLSALKLQFWYQIEIYLVVSLFEGCSIIA